MEEDRSKTKVAKVKIWELTTSCKDFGLLLQRHLNARDNSIKTCQNFHTPSIQQTNNYCFELFIDVIYFRIPKNCRKKCFEN